MRTRIPWVGGAVLVVALAGVGSAAAQQGYAASREIRYHTDLSKGGQEEFGHYLPVVGWLKPLPEQTPGEFRGYTYGSVGSVFAESPDRIWIAMRGVLPLPEGAAPWTPYGKLDRGNATGNPDGVSATCQQVAKRGWERVMKNVIFVVDRNGNQIEAWRQHDALFEGPCGRGPHKIKINPYDPEKHVWVIDDQLHLIHRFTHDGRLVKTLGTRGQRGRGPNLFDRPTDIDWLPDGTYFISDGYGGVRVAKFDRNDNFIMDWGQAPRDRANPGPNEFNTVHSIAISRDRRLFVADRGHRRIQVFDENGKFLDMINLGAHSLPYAHLITEDQYLIIVDGGTNRVLKYDLNGRFIYGWGAPGGEDGFFNGPHAVTIDQEGNFYTAEVFGGRVQKFTPLPGADPEKLAGQQFRGPS